jgi:CubicO group peptidase (beta-lactamase class C family)
MNMGKTNLAATGLIILWCNIAMATEWPNCGVAETFPAESWQLADAAEHSWDASKLATAQALFESLDSAAVMVVYRGHLIADWGDTDQKFTAQSIRKSLINSLVGLEIDNGDLRLDATLEELGIDDTQPNLTESERQATVSQLLLSRSGIYHSALYEVGRWKRVRAAIQADKLMTGDDRYGPGGYWVYNNWDFNALGTIVEKVGSESIGQLFEEKISSPIHMEDFEMQDVAYTSKDSFSEQHLKNWSEHRAYVFDISTRDLARYGLLYLNCGRWEETPVVPESWVLESTEGVDTRIGRPEKYRNTSFGDWGYLWQVDHDGSRRYTYLKTREPFYMGTGNRGHVLVVMPYLDLVIVHQVATVGGIGLEAQKRRATEGSPRVESKDIQRLIAAILAAHPQGDDALVED